MSKEIIAFGNIEIEKRKFYHRKNLILLGDVDINNIPISNMVSSGEKMYKYFIGYKDDDYKIKPLHIMFPKTSAYAKGYDGETKWMNVCIKDNDLLKKHNNIWNNVSNGIKKNLIANTFTIKKVLKTKMNSHGNKATNFHMRKSSEAGSNKCVHLLKFNREWRLQNNFKKGWIIREKR